MYKLPTLTANSLDDLMRQLKERQGNCILERITIVIKEEIMYQYT